MEPSHDASDTVNNNDNIVVPLNPDGNGSNNNNNNNSSNKLSADGSEEHNYLNATAGEAGDGHGDPDDENNLNGIVEVANTTVSQVPDGNGIAHEEGHDVEHLAPHQQHDGDPMGNGNIGQGQMGQVQHHGQVPEHGGLVEEEEGGEEAERDLVHEVVEEERNGAPHDSRKHHAACLIGFVRKPASLMQAMDTLELGRLSNAQCKVMLSVMNVTGCKNSNLAAKKYILACKMVQRQVTLQSLFDITSRLNLVQPQEQRADGGTAEAEVARIKSLPKTSASADPVRPGQGMVEVVNWARGDVPIFVNNEVVIGEPSLDATGTTTTTLMQHNSGDVDGALTVSPLVIPAHQVPISVSAPHVQDPLVGSSDLKRRLSRTTPRVDEVVSKRRRRSISAGATTTTTTAAADSTTAELQIKEAEAQSASARAVSDTLKAIKGSESMMSAEAEDPSNETRDFYKQVIATLRQKMASILGMQFQFHR